MKDTFNKTLLFGLGTLVLTKDKMEELVQELMAKGEVSQKQGENLIEELEEKAEHGKRQINESLQGLVEDALEHLDIPRREDIERLERKLQILEEKVEEVERRRNE